MADKAAIVTGASSGIGYALAQMLLGEGFGVTAAARRPEKLTEAVERLRGVGTGEVEEVAGNMAHEEDIQEVVAATASVSAVSTSSSTTPASASARPCRRS